MTDAEGAAPGGGDGTSRALELLSDVLVAGPLKVETRLEFAADLAEADSAVDDDMLARWFKDALQD